MLSVSFPIIIFLLMFVIIVVFIVITTATKRLVKATAGLADIAGFINGIDQRVALDPDLGNKTHHAQFLRFGISPRACVNLTCLRSCRDLRLSGGRILDVNFRVRIAIIPSAQLDDPKTLCIISSFDQRVFLQSGLRAGAQSQLGLLVEHGTVKLAEMYSVKYPVAVHLTVVVPFGKGTPTPECKEQ